MNITSGGALSFRLIILCALWFITYELVAMNAIFSIRFLFHFYLRRPFFHFVIVIAIALILNIKLARDVFFFVLFTWYTLTPKVLANEWRWKWKQVIELKKYCAVSWRWPNFFFLRFISISDSGCGDIRCWNKTNIFKQSDILKPSVEFFFCSLIFICQSSTPTQHASIVCWFCFNCSRTAVYSMSNSSHWMLKKEQKKTVE